MENTSACSVGWICTSPSQFATAKAMLDVKHTDYSIKHDNPDVYLGRIGPVNVVIRYIPPSLSSATDLAIAVQSILAGPGVIKSILVTGVISVLNDSDISPGDLIINAPTDRHEDNSGPSTTERSLSQQSVILQREVGHDGRWLSSNFPAAASCSLDSPIFTQPLGSCTSKYLRLHYGIIGQDDQNKPKAEMVATKSAQDLNAIARAFKNLTVDVITILTADGYIDSNGNVDKYAAVNAASFVKELIRGMPEGLTNTIAGLKGTETLVPPNLGIEAPHFEPQQLPRHGNAVLLVIPTANKSKGKLLGEGLKRHKPKDVILHSISVPFDSDVGEQPYNEAGVLGAYTRISNASRHLNTPEYQEMLTSKGIGTVLIASIENYIQLDNVERPIDYGLVVIHNASRGDTTAGLSWGVTVPPAYIDRARRFGFDGDFNYGRVTVGQILAAHVPGLDKADFHIVLAGRSRYDLLNEVIGRLTIPW